MSNATDKDRTQVVTIEYIGNSCILITAPDGTRVVSDPYGEDCHPPQLANLLPGALQADGVAVSHTHPDHNNVAAVGGNPQILTEPGTLQVGAVKVTGYAGREGSPSGPSAEMANTVFVFEVGGAKIVHMGDSGIITDPEVLAAVENADVILVNIDGYVIPLAEIMPFMQRIRARTVFLTHYSLAKDARWVEAPTVEEYLQTLPAGLAVARKGSQIEVVPGMPNQVVVLTPLMLVK